MNGYFLTGDIVRRDSLGRYHHLDRLTDTVTTEDGPVFTLLYEECVMNAIEDLLDCTLVAIQLSARDAYLVCFTTFRRDRVMHAAMLREKVDAAMAVEGYRQLDEIRVVPVHAIPVGVTGKVLKARLRETLRAELLEAGVLRSCAAGVTRSPLTQVPGPSLERNVNR